jgi:hypothetical protein
MMGVAVPTEAIGAGLDSTTAGTLDVSSGETGLEAGRDGTETAVATEEAGTTTADETGADSYEPAVGTVETEVALGVEETEETSGTEETETAAGVEAETAWTAEETGRVIMVAAVRTVVPIVAPAGHQVVVLSITLVT